MIPQPLQKFLSDHQVRWRARPHAPRWTAQETAQAAHVSGRSFAKTVLLRTAEDGQAFFLAVLPANEEVDLGRLGDALGRTVSLASEDELARLFPDFEVGAAPPFGELAGIPVVVDACLADSGWVAFNGGTHTDVIEMRWVDFQDLVRPRMIDYGRPSTR